MLDTATPERKNFEEELKLFIGRLEAEADDRVKRRNHIESRWLQDLRQYHGQYDEDVQIRFKETNGSQIFKNATRPKTDLMIARIWDMLFPTDDRNWAIRPTPVPEMIEQSGETEKLAVDAEGTFADLQRRLAEAEEKGQEDIAQGLAADMTRAEKVRDSAKTVADEMSAVRAEAQRKARLMQAEIEDQLIQSRHPSEARRMLEDCVKLGTGVIKGPVLNDNIKRRWSMGPDGKFALTPTEDSQERPSSRWVDVWNFFPSMDAPSARDSTGYYERHLMTKTQLRRLAKRPDIDENMVREIMKDGGEERPPSYVTELQAVTGQNDGKLDDLYVVWEYSGPIDQEDVETLNANGHDTPWMEGNHDDPLWEMEARIWFSNSRLLSFKPHPLDSCDPIYHVLCFKPDERSPFGTGLPRLIRDEQELLNGAARMLADNAGLTVGPQVIVNKMLIAPEDGGDDYSLEPMKIWERIREATDPAEAAFEVIHIDGHIEELAGIIELAEKSIDEVTQLPMIAQGEQGAQVTQTASGMALLMNSANTNFKRFVKDYDDDISVPLISSFYHWNMQFSPRSEIKGDFEVDARGASVLLVREMQIQNLLMSAERLGSHPIYGPMHHHHEVLTALYRAMQIPTDEIVKTESEIERDQQEKAKTPPPEIALEQAALALKKMEIDFGDRKLAAETATANAKIDIERRKLDMLGSTEAAKLDESARATDAVSGDKAAAAAIKAEQAERALNAEIAMAVQTGKSSGGSV